MSSNTKDVDSKDKMVSEGSKNCSYSMQSIASEVQSGMKKVVPGYLNYDKKYRADKVKNKANFKVAPENKMIMGK